MPSQTDHETQWASNHRLLASLIKSAIYPDWTATVAFYAALHSIERYFARRGEHPNDHKSRELTLLKYQSILGTQLLNDFRYMYNTSRTARYYCVLLTATQVQNQISRLERIDKKVGPLV